jgi:hypothetical protein
LSLARSDARLAARLFFDPLHFKPIDEILYEITVVGHGRRQSERPRT